MKMGSHFFVSSHHTVLCHLIQSHLFFNILFLSTAAKYDVAKTGRWIQMNPSTATSNSTSAVIESNNRNLSLLDMFRFAVQIEDRANFSVLVGG